MLNDAHNLISGCCQGDLCQQLRRTLEWCASVTLKTVQNKNSHILDHDVLVWHQAIDAVVPSLPPVLRRPLVQQQRGALLEGQLPGRSAHVVKLGDGFDGLTLCPERGRNRRSESDRPEVSARRLSWRPVNTDGTFLLSVCSVPFTRQRVLVLLS